MSATHPIPLVFEARPLPISLDADNVARVGNTRVTLDTVIAAFINGATAEEIVYQYPSLNLSDIYLVIGYYLQHRAEVDKYLRQRQKQMGIVRKQNESRCDPSGIRDRLLARKNNSS
jgi:uncharacterized protein (DUF433 family)